MRTVKLALAASFAFTLLCAVLLALPGTSAASTTSRLGGGNALLRATTGITNANIASNILSRLQFAGLQGGQSDDVPADDEDLGSNGDPATTASPPVGGSAGYGAGNGGTGNNGGAQAGDGGNGADGGGGGSGGPGGLIRAGNVVSTSNAINTINTVIIRIGR